MEGTGEKYLPIGSVVRLKEGKKNLMITGFVATDEANPSKVYDYTGCLSPEGIISKQTALFNHDQIEKVIHVGLDDEDEKKFKDELKKLVAKKESYLNDNVIIDYTKENNNPEVPNSEILDVNVSSEASSGDIEQL